MGRFWEIGYTQGWRLLWNGAEFSTSVKFVPQWYYAGMYLVRMGRLSGSMRNEYQPKWWKPFNPKAANISMVNRFL